MLMAEGVDTGDMLIARAVDIGENETASELHDRLSELGAEVLLETVEAVKNGTLSPVPQDDSLSTHAPMLTKDMCRIDFSKTAQEVHNQIRGLSAFPCATAVLDGRRLKVYKSELVNGSCGDAPYGTVVNAKDFTVSCGDGCCVRFTEIQAEGGKE